MSDWRRQRAEAHQDQVLPCSTLFQRVLQVEGQEGRKREAILVETSLTTQTFAQASRFDLATPEAMIRSSRRAILRFICYSKLVCYAVMILSSLVQKIRQSTNVLSLGLAVLLITLETGCGGGGGSSLGGSIGGAGAQIFDSSGKAVTGATRLASSQALAGKIKGYSPHGQVAFVYSGPTGATLPSQFGMPACSYCTILPLDKNGDLPSTAIGPKLPAGTYRLDIYDLAGEGTNRKGTLKSSSTFTVEDAPKGVPALHVGTLAGTEFTVSDSFAPGDSAYVRASGFGPNQVVDIYVTAHQTSWSNGDKLLDVSGTVDNLPPGVPPGTRGLAGTVKTVRADTNGVIAPVLLWNSVGSEADQRTFDVIADPNRTGRYDSATDTIMDQTSGSFVVDSINRGGGNTATLAFNESMVATQLFNGIDNVKTKLSSRAVPRPRINIALISIVKHKDVWNAGDDITDISGPSGTSRGAQVDIVGRRLRIPPMIAYHADLAPGDYDIIVDVGANFTYNPATCILDSAPGKPSFKVSGDIQKKKWTVMVYLNADSNLAPNAPVNMHEMESVVYKNTQGLTDVNVLVQYTLPGGETNRYVMAHTTDPSQPVTTQPIEALGTKNTGDPQTLSEFISWAKHESPADHYVLVMWDHGGGFQSRNLSWSTTFNNQSISVPQLHQVLKSTGPFDLVACDTCLMGMNEVVYELRDTCQYMVVSENLEPGHGYDYAGFLKLLVANPDMVPKDIGTNIVNSYGAYYVAHPGTFTGASPTSSCIDMSKVADITTAVNNFCTSLTATTGTDSIVTNPTNHLLGELVPYQKFDSPARFWFGDSKDWFGIIRSGNVSPNINALCDGVTNAITAAVVAEYHDPSFTGAHGLTMWLPNIDNFTQLKDEYKALQYASDSGWLNFIETIFKPFLIDENSTNNGTYIPNNGSVFFIGLVNVKPVTGAVYKLHVDIQGDPTATISLTGDNAAVDKVRTADVSTTTLVNNILVRTKAETSGTLTVNVSYSDSTGKLLAKDSYMLKQL